VIYQGIPIRVWDESILGGAAVPNISTEAWAVAYASVSLTGAGILPCSAALQAPGQGDIVRCFTKDPTISGEIYAGASVSNPAGVYIAPGQTFLWEVTDGAGGAWGLLYVWQFPFGGPYPWP
jgi:hypothetical protein